MTAEVAILNKSAVALAADSAVTISAGQDQHKIFDSADKLFELTQGDAIAIMINNDMNFMEAPLPVLIKEYRQTAPRFARVRDAADAFLQYLDNFARQSPERIKLQALEQFVRPIMELIATRSRDAWLNDILDEETGGLKSEFAGKTEAIAELAKAKVSNELQTLEDAIEGVPDATFIGTGAVTLTESERAVFDRLASEVLVQADDALKERTVGLIERVLLKSGTGNISTGIIVAGFGSDELFPTLISFELRGVVGDRLKFSETNVVDIDREGVKARVLPFAQREMVERFLYGLDTPIRDSISQFCRDAIPKISEELMSALELTDDDFEKLVASADKAESAFIEGLQSEGFNAIQSRSETEIEDMVEFMPKPEMARMAEALVNLTSIKRRVSRGFETVGGPIDVAIISKAEGFVWVSRKHYFPQELNARYFERIRDRT